MSIPMCSCSPETLAKLARFLKDHPEFRESDEGAAGAAFLDEYWATLPQDDRESIAFNGLRGEIEAADTLLGRSTRNRVILDPDDMAEADTLLLAGEPDAGAPGDTP